MRELADRLEAWRAAGLVTPEQLAAINAFEVDQSTDAGTRRTVFAEAVGYVGSALAVGAIALLVGNLWTDLTTPGRLAVVGLLSVILFGAGLALRRVERAPIQRLASVLFTGSIVGVGWLAAIVATDVVSLDDGQIGVAIGAATLLVALPLYLLRQRALPQVTVMVTVVILALSALSLTAIEPDPVWYFVVAGSIGAAWFALAAGGWLRPRVIGEVTGAALTLLACQTPAGDWPWLMLLGALLAGGLVGLAVMTDRMHHLVVGAIGLFLLVPRLVFELFGDSIGAPAAMLVIGLLLVLLAVGIGRVRREVDADQRPIVRPSPPWEHLASDDGTREEVRR